MQLVCSANRVHSLQQIYVVFCSADNAAMSFRYACKTLSIGLLCSQYTVRACVCTGGINYEVHNTTISPAPVTCTESLTPNSQCENMRLFKWSMNINLYIRDCRNRRSFVMRQAARGTMESRMLLSSHANPHAHADTHTHTHNLVFFLIAFIQCTSYSSFVSENKILRIEPF